MNGPVPSYMDEEGYYFVDRFGFISSSFSESKEMGERSPRYLIIFELVFS